MQFEEKGLKERARDRLLWWNLLASYHIGIIRKAAILLTEPLAARGGAHL